MSYVVLARKWRPQQFDDLTGQQHVATTLTNALRQDRVPHALLFTGARGVGKTSSARILAMALNCAEGPTETPCGVCSSCVEIQRSQSVDVLEIDGASNRGINEIRELRDSVRYAPNRDRYKVYIIDEVHMLTTEAFNALLKTLEEPPEHVVFVFATTEAHKIPVTILSRCQRFDFRRIPYAEIVERLAHIASAESLQIERDVLGIIARQAAGGMRDALSLLDQVIAFAGTNVTLDQAGEILGAAERRRLFELSEAILQRDLERALNVLDTVLSFGVDVAHLAQELVGHFRDLTLVSVTRDPSGVTALTESELETARAQVAQTETRTLHRLFERLVGAAEEIQRSAHARVRFEMTLVQLVALEPQASIDALISRLEAMAGGAVLPPAPAPSTPPAPSSAAPSSAAPSSAAPSSAAPSSAAPNEAESTHVARERPLPIDNTPPPTATPVAHEEAPSSALATEEPSQEASEQRLSSDPTLAPAAPASVAVLDSRGLDAPRDDAPTSEPTATLAPPNDAASAADLPAEAAKPAPPNDAASAADLPAEAAQPAPPNESAPEDRGPPTELPLALWRALVDAIRASHPQSGALLSGALCAPHVGGEVLVGVQAELNERVTPSALEALHAEAAEQGSESLRFTLTSASALSEPQQRTAYHIQAIEEREREEQMRRLRAWVREHAAMKRIRARWPGATIERIEPTNSNATEATP